MAPSPLSANIRYQFKTSTSLWPPMCVYVHPYKPCWGINNTSLNNWWTETLRYTYINYYCMQISYNRKLWRGFYLGKFLKNGQPKTCQYLSTQYILQWCNDCCTRCTAPVLSQALIHVATRSNNICKSLYQGEWSDQGWNPPRHSSSTNLQLIGHQI